MKCIICLFLSIILSFNVFCTELWNGFTDEMRKTQVIAKANKLLDCTGIDMTNQFDEDYEWTMNGPCSGYDDSRRFPTPDCTIVYRSKLNQYLQTYSMYDRGNVQFYFYKNRLCGVRVDWNIPYDTIYKSAVEKYGENYKREDWSIHDSFGFATCRICHWYLQDKEVIVSELYDCLAVFSNELSQQFKMDREKKEAERIKKEQEENYNRSQKLVF